MITPEILLHLGYACAFVAAVMTLIAVAPRGEEA